MNMPEALQRPFGMFLEASLSAAILALIVLAIQFALRNRLSPAWRFVLWTPVLLRLMIPVLPESSLSLFNLPRWIGGWNPPEIAVIQPPPPEGHLLFEFDASIGEGPVAAPQFIRADAAPDWRSVAAAVWLCGVVVLLARLGFGALWFSIQIRRAGATAPAAVQKILSEAAALFEARSRPNLVQATFVESPALFGLFRPTLLVPREFSSNLSETEIRHVFLHELAHLKRRDLLLNWVMAIAQTVHWFNPVVWLVFRRMRLERELACDEMALRVSSEPDPKSYGTTILRLLEGVGPRPALSTLVGIAEEKQTATQRLKQIAAFKSGRRRYWIAFPLLAAVIVAGLTNAQSPKEKEIIPTIEEEAAAPIEPAHEPVLSLKDELALVRIDQIDLEGLTLTEALDAIRKKLPADLQDIDFAWFQHQKINSDANGRYSPNAVGYLNARIGATATPADEIHLSRKHLKESSRLDLNLRLKNFPVTKLLDMVTKASERPVLYTIEEKRVTFFEEDKVSVAVLIEDARLLMNLAKFEEAEAKLKDALKADPESRAAHYYLQLLKERRYTDEARKREQALQPPEISAIPSLPRIANPYASRNRTLESPARKEILRKLNETKVANYVVDGIPLLEVIKDLAMKTRNDDPERVGVNFIISQQIPPELAETDGLPKLGEFEITIDPPLRNVRLIDVLNTIVHVAVPPNGDRTFGLKYSLEDYGVVFSYRSLEAERLYTRTYKLDPHTFLEGRLDPIFGNLGEGLKAPDLATLRSSVRDFFIAAGVDFSTNNVIGADAGPQKAIFFNDRTGILLVRHTLRDIDLIEKALQMLNTQPAQVTLETGVVKLNGKEDLDEALKLLGFTQGNIHSVLTTRAFEQLKDELKEDGRFEMKQLPKVTTLSGRPARVSIESAKAEETVSVDIRCDYMERDKALRIWASNYNPATNKRGDVYSGKIYDGQTYFFFPQIDEKNPKPSHITFITAFVIDPAGNRVNTPDDFPLQTERTPPQN